MILGVFRYIDTDDDALEMNPKIFMDEPILLFKLLRNFGHLIRNLKIEFSLFDTECGIAIQSYLEEYCSDSLQRFSFEPNELIKHFENLQRPFKNLLALKIDTALYHKQNIYVQFINEKNLPNLQYFYMRRHCVDQQAKINHKYVEDFTITCLNMITFPFSFENLKHLTLYGNIKINDAFCEYIRSLKHLKILKIHSWVIWNSNYFDKLLELQNIASNIEEIEIEVGDKLDPWQLNRQYPAETILRFMKQCQNLRKMIFFHAYIHTESCANYVERWAQQLSLILSEEWKFNIITQPVLRDIFYHIYYEFERRTNE